MIDLDTIFGYDETGGVAVIEPIEADYPVEPDSNIEVAEPCPIDEQVNPWPQAEPWPDPCERCGSLELWQNYLGDWRCTKCDPPDKARRLLEKTERIRRRQNGAQR